MKSISFRVNFAEGLRVVGAVNAGVGEGISVGEGFGEWVGGVVVVGVVVCGREGCGVVSYLSWAVMESQISR